MKLPLPLAPPPPPVALRLLVLRLWAPLLSQLPLP